MCFWKLLEIYLQTWKMELQVLRDEYRIYLYTSGFLIMMCLLF